MSQQWCGMLGCVMAALGLMGCLYSDPIVPLPSVVYVPSPQTLDGTRSAKQLKAIYATSPNLNPQGLGVYEYVWSQSRMTLMSWPLQERLEELNRIAFRRTPERQAKVLAERRAFFEENVIFWGMLFSDNSFPVDPEWYTPEGVYLVDDKGQVFRPTAVRRANLLYFFEEYYRSVQHAPEGQGMEVSYPEFVFPREAMTPQTRSVTLFLAAVQRQMSFTWVFDETYVPAFERFDPEQGVGMERVLRTRPASP